MPVMKELGSNQYNTVWARGTRSVFRSHEFLLLSSPRRQVSLCSEILSTQSHSHSVGGKACEPTV